MGEDDVQTGRRWVDRLTVQEAARRLGVSEGAVRKRVARGTIPHEKGEGGRVYVYLDTGVDAGQDEGVAPHNSTLTSQLREEIAYLREENRRKDEIIMQQAITMRQLTAGGTPAPQEAPQTAAEDAGGSEPHPATEGAQEGSGRRSSWWRRWFG